jgi:hypothetical protein
MCGSAVISGTDPKIEFRRDLGLAVDNCGDVSTRTEE